MRPKNEKKGVIFTYEKKIFFYLFSISKKPSEDLSFLHFIQTRIFGNKMMKCIFNRLYLVANSFQTTLNILQLPSPVRQVQYNFKFSNICPLQSTAYVMNLLISVGSITLNYLVSLQSAKRAHSSWLCLGMFLLPDCQLIYYRSKAFLGNNFTEELNSS